MTSRRWATLTETVAVTGMIADCGSRNAIGAVLTL